MRRAITEPAGAPPRGGSTALRLVLPFLLIVGAALALGAQLTYAAIETAYRDAVAARLRMIAEQIAATVQAGQSLGIAVEAQDTLAGLLAREAEGVPDLAGIAVLGPDGAPLFASAPGAPVPGPGDVVVPAHNDLGQTIATVRMLRADEGVEARLAELRRGLAGAALPRGLAALAGAAAALVLVLRGRMRPGAAADAPPLRAAEAALDEIADALDREGSP
jgi:hypothetical protein